MATLGMYLLDAIDNAVSAMLLDVNGNAGLY